MISDNWICTNPPRDANGKAIPLDTEILYTTNGRVFHVDQFRYSVGVGQWVAHGWYYEHKNKLWADDTSFFLLAPPDSWEKLEEDAKKIVCEYVGAPLDESGLTTCDGCRFHKYKQCYREMALDVLARAKRLAGIEEQEGK